MIKTEHVTIDGIDFVRTYSDADCYVVRDEIAYVEAYDPAEYGRTYTEGDPIAEEITEADYAQAGRIMLGVE